jgi:hypothetical protein
MSQHLLVWGEIRTVREVSLLGAVILTFSYRCVLGNHMSLY